MTRRSRMDIIIDILQAANMGASKTKIVYQANLNFNLARQYLDLLREQGLIEVNPAGSSIYKTTAQGRRYLEKASDHRKKLEDIMQRTGDEKHGRMPWGSLRRAKKSNL